MPQLLKFLRYFFLGRAQRVFCAQALTGLLLLGFGASVWTSLRTDICDQEIYTVKESDFCVWNPPIWVSDRFVAEALELRAPEARTEKLSSLDPNLVDNLLIAFESHPWVEKVESIEVRFPARVDVKLKYKEPVATIDPTPSVAIELSDSTTPAFNDDRQDGQNGGDRESDGEQFEGKYVVDANGYRLPDEYFRNNPSAYREFPIVLGIRSTPVSGFGQCGDPLVVEAAAFASFLTERKIFEKLGVDRIVVAKEKGETKGVYRLKTVGGVSVFWGRFASDADLKSASFKAKNGEEGETFALQEAKARKLFQLAEEYSSLDAVPPEAVAELNLAVEEDAQNEANAEDGAK